MKTIITILLTIFTLNANALEFIGSDKHLECAQKVAVALDIQDSDYRIYMMDELMNRKTHAYISKTNVPKTIAFVLNKNKRAGKFDTNLTIAHEMVHVMQMIRGDVFDMSKAYKHRAHEKEAYAMEKELVRVCN